MVQRADIFRSYGPQDRAPLGDRMLPRPLRAMQDIEPCRPEALGGQVDHGETCQAYHDSSHACQRRPWPKCQPDQAEQWLEAQKRLLLPVPYVMVPCTLPSELRGLARRHQKPLSHRLLRRAAAAVQELAFDPRCIGGRIGMVGVLHTWPRALRDHPHGHDIVAAGGLSAEGAWRPSRQEFLVHVTPLAVLFRAKFRTDLQKTDLFPLVAAHVWNKAWVVHCQPVGSGEAAFRSLAPYSVRVALSNNRVLKLDDGHVTGPYQDSATQQTQSATVPAPEGLRRFLQPVLPDRFSNVRYDGFRSPGNRPGLTRVSQ
jgi:hypothetical protein